MQWQCYDDDDNNIIDDDDDYLNGDEDYGAQQCQW